MPLSFPQQLEAARITGSTPISQGPATIGTVEQIVALLLGYTPDLNITAAAIALAHDGTKLTVNKHLVSAGSTPGIAAGAGAGGSPTIAVSGNDLVGEIALTIGTSPSSGDPVLFTLTFATTFGATPFMMLVPSNANAAGAVAIAYIARGSCSATQMVVGIHGSTPLTTGLQYKWTYLVIGV